MARSKKTAPKRIVPKTACYCRVSSDSQKHDSQREEIKRWLQGNKIKLAEVTWFEDTETGATTERKALQRLQKAIFHGEVDTLVFWKLDRISRDMRDGINLLADWCEKGLRVVLVTEQIDLSGPVGRMAAVARIYHIERHRRSAQMVARQFAPLRRVPTEHPAAPKPVGKKLWASLEKSMKTVIETTRPVQVI